MFAKLVENKNNNNKKENTNTAYTTFEVETILFITLLSFDKSSIIKTIVV